MKSSDVKSAKCPICDKGQLHEEVGEFRTDFVADDGERREVVVPQVKKLVCDQCGEYILDPESESRISAAQRRALRLLAAEDLTRFRNSLNKSQAGMADLLGLGKKTWCRWESNDYFQSEAFDRYLRLLMFAPTNVQALQAIDKEKREGEIDLSNTFRYIADVKSTAVFAEQFKSVLMDGPFN